MNVVPIIQEETEPTFADFWCLQVKKVGKLNAEKEWNKIPRDKWTHVIVAWAAWRPIYQAREWQYILDPERWLKYGRYDDELPISATSQHASHAPAELPVLGPKTAMPDGVRQLIARLRK